MEIDTKTFKELRSKVGVLESTIAGALDGLQFDADEVIERSVVLEQLQEQLLMAQEIQKILNDKRSV